MPALLMTAAEIAAAEALAAEILIAQQAAAAAAAAAEAVQVANAAQAAQAATTATQAATQAGTQAAAQAGTQAATQASTSGIQALAQEVGATVQPTGIETLTQAPLQTTTSAAELEQMRQAASGAQNLVDTSVKIADVASSSPVKIVDAANFPGSATNPLSTLTPTNVPPSQSVPLTEAAPSVAPPADFGKGTGEALGRGSYASPSASVSNTPVAESALDKYLYQRPTYMDGTQGMTSSGANASKLQTSGDPFYNINSGHIDQTFGRPGFELTSQYVEPSAYSSNLPAQPATGLQGLIDKSITYAKDNPLQTGFGAMSLYNMLNQPKPYKKEKYKSTFDSSTYRPYEPTPPDPPYRPQYPQYAQGGLADLGGYADYAHGGRMLKGPGDGMSDDIPATIAGKQPARLANEEFVIPADVVSHLGNGSSEAGAKALYKMMDRVRQARTGNKKQGKQINPEKFLA